MSDKNAAPLPEVSTEDLAPYAGGPDQPASALREALDALTTASTAKPKELDWEAQYDGLLAARRLTKHHGTLVAPGLHQLVLALVPAVDALRSSVAKQATALAREMALFLPAEALDAELEYLLPALAKNLASQRGWAPRRTPRWRRWRGRPTRAASWGRCSR